MFDFLVKNYAINLKEFNVGSINYFGWKLGIEFELNFREPLLPFNLKENNIRKDTLNLAVSIEY